MYLGDVAKNRIIQFTEDLISYASRTLIPLRTPIQQLDETHELESTKSQESWTLGDNYLDFDLLPENYLTDQIRHYTITKTNKSH